MGPCNPDLEFACPNFCTLNLWCVIDTLQPLPLSTLLTWLAPLVHLHLHSHLIHLCIHSCMLLLHLCLLHLCIRLLRLRIRSCSSLLCVSIHLLLLDRARCWRFEQQFNTFQHSFDVWTFTEGLKGCSTKSNVTERQRRGNREQGVDLGCPTGH